MCALVPPLFPNFGWPSEEQMYGGGDINDGEFLEILPASLGVSNSSEGEGKRNNTVVKKKLNHNASERDRRKKINALFSSLRSLLPSSDHSKKLSIPATVSHAMKHIAEQQEQIKKLMQKKEELLSRLSGQRDLMCDKDGDDHIPTKAINNTGFASTVSATRLGKTQVMVQISSSETRNCSFSNVLRGLEEDGFIVTDVSSSQSQGDWLFYSLHFQVEIDYKLTCQDLSDKLLSLYETSGSRFIRY